MAGKSGGLAGDERGLDEPRGLADPSRAELSDNAADLEDQFIGLGGQEGGQCARPWEIGFHPRPVLIAGPAAIKFAGRWRGGLH